MDSNSDGVVRPCRPGEFATILSIINEAAEAYRGIVPADCLHDPYMSAEELRLGIDAGIAFSGIDYSGDLAGVMGIQHVRDVDLIRHAYVRTSHQRRGIGAAVLQHLRQTTTRPILVGTWSSAQWAIDFYQRHGFELVSRDRKDELLATYWTIPSRQAEMSVVLAERGRSP